MNQHTTANILSSEIFHFLDSIAVGDVRHGLCARLNSQAELLQPRTQTRLDKSHHTCVHEQEIGHCVAAEYSKRAFLSTQNYDDSVGMDELSS